MLLFFIIYSTNLYFYDLKSFATILIKINEKVRGSYNFNLLKFYYIQNFEENNFK